MAEGIKYVEADLVSLLKQRSQEAFHYLYDNYSGPLHTIIITVVKDTAYAADILQEVFIKIWKQIEQYDDSKGRLFTWMANIARNASIDMLRSKGYRNEQKNQELPNNVYQISGADAMKPETIGLRNLLQKLKPEYKAVLDLSYFQGFSHNEISKILNIPIGTVKTRIRSAVIQLRSMVNE